MAKLTEKLGRGLATAGLVVGFALPAQYAAAQSQQNPLSALAPVIGELAKRDRDRLSDDEIEDRARERGFDAAVQDGRLSPLSALRGAQAYRSEKKRLERERERQKEERQRRIVNGLLRAFGGGAR